MKIAVLEAVLEYVELQFQSGASAQVLVADLVELDVVDILASSSSIYRDNELLLLIQFPWLFLILRGKFDCVVALGVALVDSALGSLEAVGSHLAFVLLVRNHSALVENDLALVGVVENHLMAVEAAGSHVIVMVVENHLAVLENHLTAVVVVESHLVAVVAENRLAVVGVVESHFAVVVVDGNHLVVDCLVAVIAVVSDMVVDSLQREIVAAAVEVDRFVVATAFDHNQATHRLSVAYEGRETIEKASDSNVDDLRRPQRKPQTTRRSF